MAAFDHRHADRLLELQREPLLGEYRPGPYTHFVIHEPSAAASALPAFATVYRPSRTLRHHRSTIERVFIPDSYANRLGKGTHRAVERCQHFSRQHFTCCAPISASTLPRSTTRSCSGTAPQDSRARHHGAGRRDPDGGADALNDEYDMVWFADDDLLAACRPRGLPIGNLSSQFWSNRASTPSTFREARAGLLRLPALAWMILHSSHDELPRCGGGRQPSGNASRICA